MNTLKPLTLCMCLLAAIGCQTPPPTASQNLPPAVHPKTLKGRAMEILRSSLRHENPYIRNHAIEVVVETGQKELIAEVLRLTDDETVPVRFAATIAAGDMECIGCEQAVRQRLEDEDQNVRIAAAYSLVKLNYPQYHEMLREAAGADDQTVRANAALLLGKAGDSEDVPLLYQMMRDERADERVRFQTVESIARLKDHRLYRSKLWALLISKFADDRAMGIRGMGALGSGDAQNAIITMLNDDVLEVRLLAAEQLGRLGNRTGRDEVAAFFAGQPDLNEPAMADQIAVQAVGYIGAPELTGYLPRALNSRSDLIRLTAAQSVLLLAR